MPFSFALYFNTTIIMSVIIILLVASMLVAGGFLVAFLWSVKNGQFDDTYGPSIRMLFDDKIKENK
jgi:cbb3-type cytochrome oxidase maturation protein